jgi:hypothetical protein
VPRALQVREVEDTDDADDDDDDADSDVVVVDENARFFCGVRGILEAR